MTLARPRFVRPNWLVHRHHDGVTTVADLGHLRLFPDVRGDLTIGEWIDFAMNCGSDE